MTFLALFKRKKEEETEVEDPSMAFGLYLFNKEQD